MERKDPAQATEAKFTREDTLKSASDAVLAEKLCRDEQAKARVFHILIFSTFFDFFIDRCPFLCKKDSRLYEITNCLHIFDSWHEKSQRDGHEWRPPGDKLTCAHIPSMIPPMVASLKLTIPRFPIVDLYG